MPNWLEAGESPRPEDPDLRETMVLVPLILGPEQGEGVQLALRMHWLFQPLQPAQTIGLAAPPGALFPAQIKALQVSEQGKAFVTCRAQLLPLPLEELEREGWLIINHPQDRADSLLEQLF